MLHSSPGPGVFGSPGSVAPSAGLVVVVVVYRLRRLLVVRRPDGLVKLDLKAVALDFGVGSFLRGPLAIRRRSLPVRRGALPIRRRPQSQLLELSR